MGADRVVRAHLKIPLRVRSCHYGPVQNPVALVV